MFLVGRGSSWDVVYVVYEPAYVIELLRGSELCELDLPGSGGPVHRVDLHETRLERDIQAAAVRIRPGAAHHSCWSYMEWK